MIVSSTRDERKRIDISELEECHLSPSHYADIAPLPIPLAEYQLRRFRKKYMQMNSQKIIEMFLEEIRQKRETVFEVLDDFARNQDKAISPEFRLSTECLTTMLAAYDPFRTMPPATYKSWQRRGIIRMKAHGKPLRCNAAAVLMIRILDRQKENIFPDFLALDEPNYWCNVVETPESSPKVIPVNHIHRLPDSAIVWTPWAGAAWDDHWHIIGHNEDNLAAIRFAGVKPVKGELWWDVDLETLMRWDKPSASLYTPLNGHHERQVEDIAPLVLNRVFAGMVPVWNRQEKTFACWRDE